MATVVKLLVIKLAAKVMQINEKNEDFRGK
jgi:hypothetical protein